MSASFRLGRILGVPVGVNWSVLVIFALIAAGLSTVHFPAAYPGHPALAYALAGIAAALVFFGGLLAHEISHAVVAMRNGLQVRGITLWLLGGVAELGGEAPSPGAELRIAGIGPLVSLAIGAVFAGLTALVAAAGADNLTVGAFAWLAGINVALAVFNVLPAAPLDGGRLLRAALWRWRGDRVWAATVAARSGRALGFLLVGLGLVEFLVGAGIGGLWLAILGWFLLGAAAAEQQQAVLGSALAGVQVKDVMSADPQTVPADMSAAEFVGDFLLTHRHTAFPLTTDGRPVGLVTLDRVRQIPSDQRLGTPLRQVACPPDELTLTSPSDSLTDLLPRLGTCADGRALVVDGERLVGIVSPTDINRAIQIGRLHPGQRAGSTV